MSMPDFVNLVEVGPRDGLQNEPVFLPTSTKIRLIEMLADCGVRSIEAGAFVSPKWVPQMADSKDVFTGLNRSPGVSYSALTPNVQGLEAALAVGVEEVAIFAAASESFSRKNINCTIAESIERFLPVCEHALSNGVRVRGYISCVMGCPYEGDVSIEAVASLTQRLIDAGCYEVSLGDTIGCGTPGQAVQLIECISQAVPIDKLAAHFHDTYGQALANIHAVLALGIQTIDCSVAGLGGCPYAKGASGNVATEDVLYMLNGLGIKTGVDMAGLLDASAFISRQIGRPSGSKVALAMNGPMDQSS